MKVKQIMTKGAEIVGPDTMLVEAARKMKDNNIGSLPVAENDRLVGMVTDRDITVRAVAEGKDPIHTRVRDVYTQGIEYCFEDDDIEKAAKHMESKQIRRLPVVDSNKRLVGVVSLGDFTESRNEELVGEMMDSIAEPLHKKE